MVFRSQRADGLRRGGRGGVPRLGPFDRLHFPTWSAQAMSGAGLDAAPDVVMLISAAVWLYWLDPKAVSEQLGPFVLFCLYPVSVLALVLIKRRREVSGYSYLAKLGTFVAWVFMTYTFEAGVSWPVMIGAIILSYIDLAEDLLLLALNDDLDGTSKEILFGRDTLVRLYPKKSPGNDLQT
jgi:hypothetical protein